MWAIRVICRTKTYKNLQMAFTINNFDGKILLGRIGRQNISNRLNMAMKHW